MKQLVRKMPLPQMALLLLSVILVTSIYWLPRLYASTLPARPLNKARQVMEMEMGSDVNFDNPVFDED